MKRCPTCNAKYSGKPRCHRCGTNLEKLVKIKNRASMHLIEAQKALREKDFPRSRFHANRAVSLHRTPRALQLLAITAFLQRDYDEALKAWKVLSE